MRSAFGSIDSVNARIAANQGAFGDALAGIDDTISTFPFQETGGVDWATPIGSDGQSSGTPIRLGDVVVSGKADPSEGSWDSSNWIAQALTPVGAAATALANLNDRVPGLADALVIAGGAVIGGGGVAQVLGRVFKAVGGEALNYARDKVHDLVVDKINSYLQQNTDLNPLTRELVSQAGGFGVDAVSGVVAGIGSSQVIDDAKNVRRISSDNYRGRYNADRYAQGLPRLPRDNDAHHRIPQVYADHPEFKDFDFHDPANIRGVPNALSGQNIHQEVTNRWEQFRRENPNATRQQIESFANKVDDRYSGQWFK